MGRKAQPRRQAVALGYTPEERDAPFLLASGRGLLAEKILELARGKGIPIHTDPALATALGQLRLGEEIHEELYLAVAQVLAYVLRAELRAASRTADPPISS